MTNRNNRPSSQRSFTALRSLTAVGCQWAYRLNVPWRTSGPAWEPTCCRSARPRKLAADAHLSWSPRLGVHSGRKRPFGGARESTWVCGKMWKTVDEESQRAPGRNDVDLAKPGRTPPACFPVATQLCRPWYPSSRRPLAPAAAALAAAA